MLDSVKTKRFEMRYMRFGCGKDNLVILPGLSIKSVLNSAAAVESAYSLFKEMFTVWLFDRRENLPRTYKIKDMARDTAIAMKILKIKDACIFGTSQGGMIAQCLAIYHPDLVSKLILGSTASRISSESHDVLQKWIDLAESGNVSELKQSFAKAIYSEELYKKAEKLFSSPMGETDEDLKRFVKLAKSSSGFDVYNDLDKIKCPVLVIGAENDCVLGAKASVEIAEKAGCDLYMYEGYGHAVYDEAPDYKERMIAFLKKN